MPTHECKPLLDTRGLDIYNRNAFRLLGADVDQKGRRIKRKEKELQAAIEVGELADEYTDALRPNPAPTREQLSEASRALADPQKRFIHEFFWFWPLQWGKGASDEVLSLLKANKVEEALDRWARIAKESGEASLVAGHNLAVLGHLFALNREQKILESRGNGKLTNEQQKKLGACWSFAFKHWESLCEDESFWSMQADRIRALDDPRLTTGFLRRFSQSLPIAFDNINADLAVAYCDREMYARAKDHVQIMKATNAGYDDVDASLRRVTEPLHDRIDHAIETATYQLRHNKEEGKQRCIELFNTVQRILSVFQTLLGEESQEYRETCDRVAESMLQCQVVYGNETEDWGGSIPILEMTLNVARGEELRARIEENLGIVRNNRIGDVCWFCDDRPKEDRHSVKVTLEKPIRWREIKSNPEQYRDALLQIASQFTSNSGGMAHGRLSLDGMNLIATLLTAKKIGNLHALVRALDTLLDNSQEIMTQQITATVPRCHTCSDIHSKGTGESVDSVQRELKLAEAAVEREAGIMNHLKTKIAHYSRKVEVTFLLGRWWALSVLKSLRGRERKCKSRFESAKAEQVRLQSQLEQRKAIGIVRPYGHFEAWPAVVEANENGFRCCGDSGGSSGGSMHRGAAGSRSDVRQSCPHCGNQQVVAASNLGNKVQCMVCRRTYQAV